MKPFAIAVAALLVLVVAAATVRVGKGGRTPREPARQGQEGNDISDPLSVRDSFTTNQIELVKTYTMEPSGYTVEFYRNRAYSCAKEGYQTFVIGYKKGTPPNASRPLWIRIHGGGVGYFEENGAFVGFAGTDFRVEESDTDLMEFNRIKDDTGLLRDILEGGEEFRFLLPSMCDHDLYAGVGTPDTFNPAQPNGEAPRVDGLLALRAALDYTTDRMETTHVFAHGTSAGSVGTMNLVTSLAKDGKRLSGAVLDAGVISEYFPQIVEEGCSSGGTIDLYAAYERIGRYMYEPHLPDDAVAAGIVETPIVDVYSKGDRTYCGQDRVTVTSASGANVTGEANSLLHSQLDAALDRHNPGGESFWHALCLGSQCDTHSVTTHAERGGESAINEIHNWVLARLKEPAPAI